MKLIGKARSKQVRSRRKSKNRRKSAKKAMIPNAKKLGHPCMVARPLGKISTGMDNKLWIVDNGSKGHQWVRYMGNVPY